MDYAGQTGPYLPVFHGWDLSNVSGDSAPRVFQFRALPAAPIRGFNVRHGAFTNIANPTDQYTYVRDITFDDVTINGQVVSR